MDEEKALLKHLRNLHKDNSIIKEAVKSKRDYVTPEDIEPAAKTVDAATLHLHALQLLGDNTGYGIEDRRLFAQLAADIK